MRLFCCLFRYPSYHLSLQYVRTAYRSVSRRQGSKHFKYEIKLKSIKRETFWCCYRYQLSAHERRKKQNTLIWSSETLICSLKYYFPVRLFDNLYWSRFFKANIWIRESGRSVHENKKDIHSSGHCVPQNISYTINPKLETINQQLYNYI